LAPFRPLASKDAVGHPLRAARSAAIVGAMKTLTKRRAGRPPLYLAAERLTETNVSLLEGFRSLGVRVEWLPPRATRCRLGPGDTVLARCDVRPTLDGVDRGVWELERAARRGVHVLNPAESMIACHDKLATTLALSRAGVAQPETVHLAELGGSAPLAPPFVLKPRFGSWGRDVMLCRSEAEYRRLLARVADRPWFRMHGVLVQELVPVSGYDLRVVVAAGRVVGAVERHAAPGEWRTNVDLGAARMPARLNPHIGELALAAARAVRGDLVGVDLLPRPEGGYVVLELNGAVDFTRHYSLDRTDVFAAAAVALALHARLLPPTHHDLVASNGRLFAAGGGTS
jgi:[lysine-biosynthesis-protein LysW]--L-2-aminoadipate ligase